jgi:hypothetical protein
MIAAMLPLLTESVQHLLTPSYDLFGNMVSGATFTEHRARVTRTPGSILTLTSDTRTPNTAATVWLIDHPRKISVGDKFMFAAGDQLTVVRAEQRALGTHTTHRVYLT